MTAKDFTGGRMEMGTLGVPPNCAGNKGLGSTGGRTIRLELGKRQGPRFLPGRPAPSGGHPGSHQPRQTSAVCSSPSPRLWYPPAQPPGSGSPTLLQALQRLASLEPPTDFFDEPGGKSITACCQGELSPVPRVLRTAVAGRPRPRLQRSQSQTEWAIH